MEILMPQLGETVAEGKITTWFKAIGDAVKPGDNLFEIETDKVSMEVPATAAGVLEEIRVEAGEVAPVGAVVAVLSGAAGATTTPTSKAVGPVPPVSPGLPRTLIVLPTHPSPAHTAPPTPAIMLDPFREVRTPERNFGPAKLSSGVVVTPLARRLAGEAGIDLGRIVPSGPHGRIVARDVEQATKGARPAAPGPSAEQIKALYADRPFDEL